jgi:hypothetical protein
VTDVPKFSGDNKIRVYPRVKGAKPMQFAVLSKDPSDEELQAFVDFLNGELETKDPDDQHAG